MDKIKNGLSVPIAGYPALRLFGFPAEWDRSQIISSRALNIPALENRFPMRWARLTRTPPRFLLPFIFSTRRIDLRQPLAPANVLQ
jgi:hypothetical protein